MPDRAVARRDAIHATWILVAPVVVVPVGLACIPFRLALPRPTAALFCSAGVMFRGGAFGFEAIQVRIEDGDSIAHLRLVVGEEMLGIALFLSSLRRYPASRTAEVVSTVKAGRRRAQAAAAGSAGRRPRTDDE